MYKNLIAPLLLCCAFTALISFKPYDAINRNLGVKPDSLATAVDSTIAVDSLFVEQSSAVMVIEPQVADTMAAAAAQREKLRKYWVEQDQLLTKEIAETKARVRAKQKALTEQQQTLVSQDDMLKLLDLQKTGKASASKARDPSAIDPATGLLSRSSGERKSRPN